MNDIVQHAEVIDKAEVLKYEPDPGSAEIPPLLLAELSESGAIDFQPACGRCKYSGHQVEQRSLSRAAGTDDRHLLTGRYRQLWDFEPELAGRITEMDVI